MKNNKRVKVLLEVIQKVYDKNPEMQEVINASKIEICSEEDTFPEQVFFIAFIIMAILEECSIDKKTAYGNFSGFIKKRRFLAVIMQCLVLRV